MHCISPPTKTKVPLDTLSTPITGQRLPGRARIACPGAGRRWPAAFGATARIAAAAQPGQGNGLGQTYYLFGRIRKRTAFSRPQRLSRHWTIDALQPKASARPAGDGRWLWATGWAGEGLGFVAKAMALAKPDAGLGGKGNAPHSPAHKTQGSTGLPPHSHPRPAPAWAGDGLDQFQH